MKTYILRDPKSVEPQKPPRPPCPEPAEPAVTALVEQIGGRPTPPPPALAGLILNLGLDMHNDTIAVSLAPSDNTEVRRYGIIGGEHDDVLKFLNRSGRRRNKRPGDSTATRPPAAREACAGAGGHEGARPLGRWPPQPGPGH